MTHYHHSNIFAKSNYRTKYLSYVASIYDPLGFISPSHVIAQVPWDARVTNINSVKTELRRSIPLAQESISATDLHVFADTSIAANCAAVVLHAVVYQPYLVNKKCSKS